MNSKTKIVCTIGPAVHSLDKIKALIHAGMNVARLNFSHGDHSQHKKIIHLLKEAREELQVPLAIMLDTKGPEIRLAKVSQEPELFLKKGQNFYLLEESPTASLPCPYVTIHPKGVLKNLQPGIEVLFKDGYFKATVVCISEGGVELQAACQGSLQAGNGMNIPSVNLDLPAMTDKDIRDIAFACEQDLDFIAASFIRCAEHVLAIRQLLLKENKPNIAIIAKIESVQGVEHFDDILQVTDGIMVARGDLGVEVELPQLPRLQKHMIKKSYQAGKPVLTATQMLESMIHHFRPTRAEVCDVANSIYDGTSSVMLSGETAMGNYPIETVKMMKKIIVEAEKDFPYEAFLSNYTHIRYHDTPSSITLSAVKAAYNSGAKAIFAYTSSGSTVRLLSRLRPFAPILALTDDVKLFHQLGFNWGVIPYYHPQCKDMEEAFDVLARTALKKELVEYGDLVVVVTGSSFGVKGTANTMILQSIGNVLVRAHPGKGKAVQGLARLLISPEEKPCEAGAIYILPQCNESYLPLLKSCAGVILDNLPHDTQSETILLQMAEKYAFSVVIKAAGALRLIPEGTCITLDPEKGVIYHGDMA